MADRAHLIALLGEMGARCPKQSAQKIARHIQLITRAEVREYVRTLRAILAAYIGESILPVSFSASAQEIQ